MSEFIMDHELCIGLVVALFGALLALIGWIGNGIWRELVSTHDSLKEHKVILSNVNGDVIQVKDDIANLKVELAKKPCHSDIDNKLKELRRLMDGDTATLIKEREPSRAH